MLSPLHKAKRIIEETYDTVLSEKHDYHLQVDNLDQSGDLGNRKKMASMIFRLAKVIDDMALQVADMSDRIEQLEEEDQHETANPRG